MQGTAQIDNCISIHKNKKEISYVQYEQWHVHDLTSDQVHGRSTSNVACKRQESLFQSVFKDVDTGEAAFTSKFTSEVRNLTILLK